MSVVKNVDKFPISKKSRRDVWYLVVFWDEKEKKLKHEDTRYLAVIVNIIEALKGTNFLLFGVWHGRYYTDLHLLNPEWLLRKAKELGIEPEETSVESWRKRLLGGD